MVQQTKDSTFSEYGLAHAEPTLSNSDKQLSISVATKRAELLDSHNESPIAVSKSFTTHFPMETSERADEAVKNSGTKRPICSPSKSNGGNMHIVYVRRKPEPELAKSNISDAQINPPDKQKSVNRDEAPLHGDSSPSFSSSNIPSPENIKTDSVKCMNHSGEVVSVARWQEEYSRLQSLLKMLDQSDQYEYVQMLQSLSSVELSRHAVELEKRSIKLSLEEAKEMQRVRFVDVLGKYGKNVSPPCNLPEQLHK